MKIVEQGKDRLVLDVGIPLLASTRCTFDRLANKVQVKSWRVFFPREREVVLSDIVRAVWYETGTDNERTEYVDLQLKSGRPIRMPTQGAAKKTVSVINTFLGGSAASSSPMGTSTGPHT